ncbi:Na(+)/citrate cotransporter isoform X3 [Rhipicephalus microplus]|uniref:Na(+)/citrate cotransporter isoform X3 n=1 Tax=Rhipicephalus microplus TaxID=6941 RepID=UPI003F6C3F0C
MHRQGYDVSFCTPVKQKTRCAYVMVLVFVNWVTRTLPLGVTALMPLLYLPALRIISYDQVVGMYMNCDGLQEGGCPRRFSGQVQKPRQDHRRREGCRGRTGRSVLPVVDQEGCLLQGLGQLVPHEITQLSAEFVVVIESLNIQTPLQMQVLISLGAATLTEFTPNDAAATMLLPVVISLACKLRLNPLYLVFPVCLSVTQACIFPASSSVIAIICDEGHVTTKDLLIPGIIVKFFCQIVNLAFINTLANYVFNLQTFPSWASACFSSAPSFGPIPH